MMDKPTLGPTGPNPVAEEQFRKAFELAKAGDLDEGILALEAALAVSPEDGRYHDLLGTLYAKKGLYEMAVAEWKRSIEADPEHAEVFRRIETAEKMRAQAPVAAQKWNWAALAALGLCFMLAVAWGTYQLRKRGSDKDLIVSLQEKSSEIDTAYVPKADFTDLEGRYQQLAASVEAKDASITQYRSEILDFRDSGKYVLQSELIREREIRNRVQSDLAAVRTENDRLTAELAAAQDATGAQNLSAEVTRRDREIAALNENYQKLNDDRKKIGEELEGSRQEMVRLRGHVQDLETQMVQMISATESIRLKSQIQDLQNQLATSETALTQARQNAGTPPEEVRLLLQNSVDAIRYVAAGDKAKAAESLRLVESKAPQGVDVKGVLSELAPQAEAAPQAPPVEASPAPAPPAETSPEQAPLPSIEPEVPAPAPEPTATPTPKPEPQPEPTRKPTPKPTPKPTKAPTQPPKPTPTKAPVVSAAPTKKLGVAEVRTVDGAPLARKASAEPPAQTKQAAEEKPATAVADRREVEMDARAQRLYQRKLTLCNQAVELIRQNRLEDASRAINEAYRIDPKDPRVQQIRDAIRARRAQ
jgi:tetratricopeptide (TPR) repeat protein